MTRTQILDPTWVALVASVEALASEAYKVRDKTGIDEFSQDPFAPPQRHRVRHKGLKEGFQLVQVNSARLRLAETFASIEQTFDEIEDGVRERNLGLVIRQVSRLGTLWRRMATEGNRFRSVPEDFGAESKDESRSESVVDSFFDSPSLPIGPHLQVSENIWEEIRTALETLETEPTESIFVQPEAIIPPPKLIVTLQQTLIERIQSDPRSIFSISPRSFEELMAELFAAQGFEVELTQCTRDGGRDIVAIGSLMGIRCRYLIECKRYAPQNNVSVAAVQRLYGIKMSEKANKAILATTSGFTRDARGFASQHVWDLDLRAYADIMQWIRSYRIE